MNPTRHKFPPAQQAPTQVVNGLKLGETGYALTGVGLSLDIDPENGDVIVNLAVAGGRVSEVIGLVPHAFKAMELWRMPSAEVVTAIQAQETRAAVAAMGSVGNT